MSDITTAVLAIYTSVWTIFDTAHGFLTNHSLLDIVILEGFIGYIAIYIDRTIDRKGKDVRRDMYTLSDQLTEDEYDTLNTWYHSEYYDEFQGRQSTLGQTEGWE